MLYFVVYNAEGAGYEYKSGRLASQLTNCPCCFNQWALRAFSGVSRTFFSHIITNLKLAVLQATLQHRQMTPTKG